MNLVADIMEHAKTVPLESGRWAAFLDRAAHLVWVTGDSQDQATTRLWAEIVEDEAKEKPEFHQRLKTMGIMP